MIKFIPAKVLGAGTPGIVALLSKDFLKLVVLSFFIASPIAWYLSINGCRTLLIKHLLPSGLY